MSRFGGIPLEDEDEDVSLVTGGRFGGIPIGDSPEEENQRNLLDVDIRDLSQGILEARKRGDMDEVLRLNELASDAKKAQLEAAGVESEYEAGKVAAGRFVTNIGRIFGLVDEEDEAVTEKIKALQKHFGGAAMLGETFAGAPGGVVTGAVKTGAKQLATATGIGALEGAAATTDAQDRFLGGALGGVISLIADLGVKGLVKAVGKAIEKVTGKPPRVPPVTDTGDLSDEARELMERGELTLGTLTEEIGKISKKPTKKKLGAVVPEVAGDKKLIEAADELGVTDVLTPGMISKSERLMDLEGALARSGKLIGEDRAATVTKLGEKADELITQHGGSLQKMDVSDSLTRDVEDTIQRMKSEAREIYNTLGDRIPKDTLVDTKAILNFVNDRIKALGGEDKLSPLEKKLLKTVRGKKVKSIIIGVDGRRKDLYKNPVITHEFIDRERKDIGKKLRAAQQGAPWGDTDTYTLSIVEDVLNQVQGDTAKKVGGDDLLNLWNSGKASVALRKDLEKRAVKVLGKERTKALLPQVGTGLKQLANKGDARAFDQAMDLVDPGRRQEVVLSALKDVMTKGEDKTKLSMGSFASWHKSLKQDRSAYRKVTSYLDDDVVKFMDNLATVSDKVNKALSKVPPTGVVESILKQFDKKGGLVSRLLPFSGEPVVAGASELVSRMNGNKGMIEKASDLLRAPEFKRMLIVAARDQTSEAAQNVESALMRSKAFKEWTKALPEKLRLRVLSVGAVPYFVSEADESNFGG